jgi:hypothetical protein
MSKKPTPVGPHVEWMKYLDFYSIFILFSPKITQFHNKIRVFDLIRGLVDNDTKPKSEYYGDLLEIIGPSK